MKKEAGIFFEFLAGHGLKFTNQRKIILNIFLNTEDHLSVDDLFVLSRREDETIGYATVHRTLKLIKESGLAREVDFGEKRKRFEHLLGHKHHDHLICTKCKDTIEVFDPKIEKLQEKLAQRYGFKPSFHRMEIFGLCKKCSL